MTVQGLNTTCLRCGAPNDAATGVNASVPSDGDVSVCITCGAIAIFSATALGLSLRQPTPGELTQIQADPTVARVQAAIAEQRFDQ